ncbi:MAG: succinylglutamate desuccinylase/aspartoacylase family protein [Candidatus Bipolaricaulia bacterium]
MGTLVRLLFLFLIVLVGLMVSPSPSSTVRRMEERMLLSEEIEGYATEVVVKWGDREGKVALVLAGMHGDEPASVHALQQLVEAYQVDRGVLVILPIQNPVAYQQGTRSSHGPFPNHYYNLGRAFPARRPIAGRDRFILDQFVGERGIWWWMTGDQALYEAGLFSRSVRYADTVAELLDPEGYRRALDPNIRQAGENIFRLMLGIFPDGQRRYLQIDLLIDLHESAYHYPSMISVDDPDSREALDGILDTLNRQLIDADLSLVTIDETPIPTDVTWAAHYELPEPALAFTVETDLRETLEARVAKQLLIVEFLLDQFGIEISRSEGGGSGSSTN